MTGDERARREAELLRRLAVERGLLPPVHVDSTGQTARDQQMLTRILASSAGPAAPAWPARTPVRKPWTWRVATAAVAAAAVVVGVLVWSSGPDQAATAVGHPAMLDYAIATPGDVAAGAAPSAAAELHGLAALARAAEGADPSAGDVQYVAARTLFLARTEEGGIVDQALYPAATQSWLAADGTVRRVEVRGSPLTVDGRLAAPILPTTVGVDTDEIYPPGTADPTLTAQLSRDPATLRAQLLEPFPEGFGCLADPTITTYCLSLRIEELWQAHVVPADLTAALWELLAAEPAVALLGATTDRAGRDVVAVAFPPSATESIPTVRVLLLAAATGNLAGTEEIVLSSADLGVTEPTVFSFQAFVTSAWVPAIGDVPGTSPGD